MEDEIKCPKCGSTQLSANKKGFGVEKAIAGAVLTGGVGLLAGTIGSSKVKITCLKCGHTFKPGEDLDAQAKKDAELKAIANQPVNWGCIGIMVVIAAIILIIAISLKNN